jgi:hypothetical protein
VRGKRIQLCAALLAAAAAPAAHASPTWTDLPSGTTNPITAIEYQSNSRFWFTTSAGEIFTRQPDGTFARTFGPSGVRLDDIEFQDGGQIGLAVGSGGQVLRSINGGANWSTVTGITASNPSSTFPDCTGSYPLGDVNAVRFAGDGRAWLFAAGAQLVRSAPVSVANVGATGTWVDANRSPSNTCRIAAGYASGLADGFFVPSVPDVGYIVSGAFSEVFFTSNNLGSDATKKPADAGNAGGAERVLAGDPNNPSRMWAAAGLPYGVSTTSFTDDGFATSQPWTIGNPGARAFPTTGPYDVDFSGGTVLAAGDDGLILNSADGRTFFYESAGGSTAWRAVGLASATQGAVGGAGGRLAVTTDAGSLPDLTAPTGAISGPDSATVGVPATFDAAAADDAGGSGIDPDGFAWASEGLLGATGPSASLTFPTAGAHTVTVTFRDRAGNSGSATKTVQVAPAPVALPHMTFPRTAPVKARRRGRLVVFKVAGRLGLPATVSAAQGCNGKVTLRVLKGRARRASKTVTLRPTCRFTATLNVKRVKLGRTKPSLSVAFGGNASVAPGAKTYKGIKIKRR